MLTGPVTSARVCHHPDEPINEIIDVAERAGLRAFSVDGDVSTEQGLNDEIGHHPPVIWVHAGAVGVEDPGDFDLQAVLTPIIEEQGLRAALALVVARARANRVHVPPIVLGLRMDMRVAIHLRRGGLENLGSEALGETQHIDCPVHAGLGRLHRVMLVMNRRSRTREIVNLVDFHIERESDVVPDHLEMLVIEQVLDIATRASKEIVDTDNDCSVPQQTLAQMRSKKAGATRDQNAFLNVHDPLLSLIVPDVIPDIQYGNQGSWHAIMAAARKCSFPPLSEGKFPKLE